MPNDTLSQQDLEDLRAIRQKLPKSDPRIDKIDRLLTLQATPEQQEPQATMGPDKRSWLQRAADYIEQKPEYEGTLASPGRSLKEKVQDLGKGIAVGSIPAAIAAPGLAAAGIAGGGLGGYGAKKGAEALGASPQVAGLAEFGGGLAGGLAAGGLASVVKGPSAMKAAAGKILGTIKGAAGKTPINTTQFADTAFELLAEKQAGSYTPNAVTKLINRIKDPQGNPLTYEEVKRFQSNISTLSANERMNLKPNTQRLLAELNTKLKYSLEEASQLGGMAPGTFEGAMKQYHQAASREEMMARLHELAVKGIKIGTGAALGGAAAGLGYDIYKIVKGEK